MEGKGTKAPTKSTRVWFGVTCDPGRLRCVGAEAPLANLVRDGRDRKRHRLWLVLLAKVVLVNRKRGLMCGAPTLDDRLM
jgi:hypothetical protein